MTRNEDALAKCPFYRLADGERISCESRVNDTRNDIVFKNGRKMLEHKRSYCDGYEWERCPYAEVLLCWWEARHGQI